MTKYSYFESDSQKPLVGDIVIEVGKDSYCLITRVGSFNFERVRIGPNSKAFKPVLSSWSKNVSSFIFIDRQDDIEWPFIPTALNNGEVMVGDIFNYLGEYIIVVEIGNVITIATIDSEHPTENKYKPFPTSSMTFIMNQEAIIPTTTKSALEWLFKDGHFPEPSDIYKDKYNVCYQVVEISENKIIMASLSESPFGDKGDWPLFLWKSNTAYNFFDEGEFICSDKDVAHAPNIGDIYLFTKDLTNPEYTDQYSIITDINDKYLAPTVLFIDNIFPADLIEGNSKYGGSLFDSLEDFINLESDGKKWYFVMNQEDIIVKDLKFPADIKKKPPLKYTLDTVKKEQIKLGTLLAYTPNADTYHDGIVVTTGSHGFSVWWLNFEGGNEPDLQEGFKQTFKFDQHLPLFLYNGHQDDYKGLEIPIPKVAKENITEKKEKKATKSKPNLVEGQIIDYVLSMDIAEDYIAEDDKTTCVVVEVDNKSSTFNIVVIDKEKMSDVPVKYMFSDYFDNPNWKFVEHQENTNYEALIDASNLEVPLMVPIAGPGKVEGFISHVMEISKNIPTLMEGVILNYYPFKDMQLPKKTAASFWTLLVIEIGSGDNHGQFKVIILDKGTAPHPPSTKESYWFNLDTYLKGNQGTLKYVMHMNDNAVMTDDEIEIAADDILTNYGVHIK